MPSSTFLSIRRGPSTFGEHFEETIEERLQEVYDWEMMHLNHHSEQEQLYAFDGIAALEQLFLVQDRTEQSYQRQTLQALEGETQQIHNQSSENSIHPQVHHIENDLTPQSLDSIVHQMEQM